MTIKDKPVVEKVIDKSTDDKINIIVKLKKYGFEYIQHLYKGGIWDPIIEYFHLRRIIYNNLSYMNPVENNIETDVPEEVKVYKKYEHIMMRWYGERKKLYGKRMDREIILLQLQIEIREAKNRYSINYIYYNLSKKEENIWEKKLIDENYHQYNEQIIINPEYIPINKIIYAAKQDPNSISYEYIYNLKQKDVMQEAIKKRNNEINNLKKKIKELTKEWKYFKGDRLWLKELDKIENVIQKGLSLGWHNDGEQIIYE